MLLVSAKVGPFKSIDKPQEVVIDEDVTVLVGMNEAGKTVFLQALNKSGDVLKLDKFDPVEDYPRKDLTSYLKIHAKEPANATTLTYRLSDKEVAEINRDLHTALPKRFTFSTTHNYANKSTIAISVDERAVIDFLASTSDLSSDTQAAVKAVSTLRAIPESLKAVGLTEKDNAFLAGVQARIAKTDETNWKSVVEWEVWQWLSTRVPRCLYFGEYEVLHSKINLADLAARAERGKTDPKQLESAHRGALARIIHQDLE